MSDQYDGPELARQVRMLREENERLRVERLAMEAVFDLLYEHLPEANAMAELPWAVDQIKRRAEQAEAELAALTKRQEWLDQVGPPQHPDDERQWIGAYLTWRGRAERAEAERDALKRDDAYLALKLAADDARERAERAEAERDALRKDAERYRWLRGGAEVPAHSVRWGRWEVNHWQGVNGWRNLLCSELDAAIDAAMRDKEQSNG